MATSALALAVLLACSPYPRLQKLPPANRRILPLASPDPRAIRALNLDASQGPDGAFDLVWTTGDGSHVELWHSRLTADFSGASTPANLGVKIEHPRTVRGSEKLSFLGWEDGRLRLVENPGARGRADRDSLGRPADEVVSVDGIAVDSTIVVAYLAYVGSRVQLESRPIELVVAAVRPAAPTVYQSLARFPHAWIPQGDGPHLALWRGEVHVVCAVGEYGHSRIFHAFRLPRSDEWRSAPDVVPGDPTTGQPMAITATLDRLFLFYFGAGILGTESTDGRHFGPVRRLRDAHPWGDSYEGRSIAASADSDHVVVVWTDHGIGSAKVPPLVSWNPGIALDVLAIASTSRRPTLADLASSPMMRISERSGCVRGIAARTNRGYHDLAWASTAVRPGEVCTIGAARVPVDLPRGK